MFFIVFLISLGGMCKFYSSLMLCVCMEPRTPAVMTMSGFIFQPCALIAVIRGLYLSCLVLMACSVYLSCVNVNSIIWTVRLGAGMSGLDCSCVTPCIYVMYGRSLARQVHLVVWHKHCRSHGGMVLS